MTSRQNGKRLGAEYQQFRGEVWEESQPCAGAFDLVGMDESSRERTEQSEKHAARGRPVGS